VQEAIHQYLIGGRWSLSLNSALAARAAGRQHLIDEVLINHPIVFLCLLDYQFFLFLSTKIIIRRIDYFLESELFNLL
jgi:hypothetical protein